MKKRSLFLSLVCSIALTIALVVVTCVSVLVPGNDNKPVTPGGQNISDVTPEKEYPNNDENNGEDKPYVIYNADSFVELLTDADNAGKSFELDRDIDFSDKSFVTLFQDVPFTGKIDGKGHALTNITVNVNKANFKDYFTNEVKDGHLESNIAVFGKVEDAEISNLTISGLNVVVGDDVYSYINDGGLNADEKGVLDQLTVGTVAAIANNSSLTNVKVEASVDAGAYAVYAEDDVNGFNAVGGMIAVANNVNIENSEVDVNLNTVKGIHYFVGGVAGYAYNSNISGVKVNANVTLKYDQVLYVGGIAGYVMGGSIGAENEEINTVVNLTVNQAADQVRFNTTGVNSINDSKFSSVAGIVNVIRADDASQAVTLNNIKVTSSVDADVVFAGAIVEVRNADLNKGIVTADRFVTIKDIVVDSNVNVLKAYGFARKLVATNISLNKTDVYNNEFAYNVKLTGNALLNNSSNTEEDGFVASMFVNDIVVASTGEEYFDIEGGFKTVKVVVANGIFNKVSASEQSRLYTKLIVD